MRARWGAALVAIAIATLPSSSFAVAVPPETFEATVEKYLLTYSAFKNYGDSTAGDVNRRLTEDRRSVLRAIVRASFITLTPKRGHENEIPPNARLVDYIEAVHGIWGVRAGDDEGKHQFRLSLRFKPGIAKVLDAAQEFRGRWWCHVLLPESVGGDDKPTEFLPSRFRFAPHPKCKWSREYPKMQVDYSEDDERVGEIDIDFDEGAYHETVANSDTRAFDRTGREERHIDALNRVHDQVMGTLVLECLISRFHGEDLYADTRCP